MPPFNLTVKSLTPPTFSSSAATVTTSPLRFTIALAPRSSSPNPLHPATYLQLAWHYRGPGRDVFEPGIITGRDLGPPAEPGVYEVVVRDVPRMRVAEGAETAADVAVFAWQGTKLLGKWDVGTVEGLGLEDAAVAGSL